MAKLAVTAGCCSVRQRQSYSEASKAGNGERMVLHQSIHNDPNHCAYIHSVLHVGNYAVVLKSTIQRENR